MPSCSAYSTMKGVRMPGVSAGSNQVGASDTWIAQVSWPCGTPAKASRGAETAAAPAAAPARISRRVIPKPSRIATGVPVAQRVKAIALLLAAPLAEPCTQGRPGMLYCHRYLYVGIKARAASASIARGGAPQKPLGTRRWNDCYYEGFRMPGQN